MSSSIPERLHQIRSRILRMSLQASSAHVGSALSCVEILFALAEAKQTKQIAIEKIILSKGHAAMALYAVAEHFGWVGSEALDKYFTDDSRLWGHPSKSSAAQFIDWSTGSLGHGLTAAAGFAFSRQVMGTAGEGLVTAVLSDGECDEGSVWESVLFAGHHRLQNLVAIIDYNKIQSFGRCDEILSIEPLADKWRAFHWQVQEVDGHNVSELNAALEKAAVQKIGPTCVIAHTVKGKGIAEIENTLASHYKPVNAEQLRQFLEVTHA